MNGPKLGELIGKPVKKGKPEGIARDAIHVAVVAVEAGELLMPGDHVGKGKWGTFARTDVTIGVVDPFLKEPVMEGDWFWLCLYPGSITSLRHDWSHPEFPPETVPIKIPNAQDEWLVQASQTKQVQESMNWLKDYADNIGVSYSELLSAGAKALATGEYFYFGEQTPDVVGEKHEEFWEHFAIVTGKTVPEAKKSHQVFACAC